MTTGSNSDLSSSDFAELTSFQRDLLVVVAGLDTPKGLEVKSELEEYYDGEINHGRLYPNLDTLAEEGFIEKVSLNERSNGYNLSPVGEQHLRQRQKWEVLNTEGHEPQQAPEQSAPAKEIDQNDEDDPLSNWIFVDEREATSKSQGEETSEKVSEKNVETDEESILSDIMEDLDNLESQDEDTAKD